MNEIDPKYRVGIAQIDREHLRLFQIIAEVEQVLEANLPSGGAPQVSHAITELVDYTRTHFASEEGLMATAQYPRLDEHRQLHSDLLRQVDDMRMRIELGDEMVTLDLSRFLSGWLIEHIQSADRDFGKFAQAQEKSQARLDDKDAGL